VGTVFKKSFTKPVPTRAETFIRKGKCLARWKDRRGKTRTAPLTMGKGGLERIVLESPFYVAKYRDGEGIVQTVTTGCRDEQAARRVLADLERRAELIKAKVMTAGEDAAARHQSTPFAEHLEAYISSLEAAGACPEHRKERRRQLRRLATDCGWRTLADMQRARDVLRKMWTPMKDGDHFDYGRASPDDPGGTRRRCRRKMAGKGSNVAEIGAMVRPA